MKNLKKMLALILSIAMVIGTISTSAFATIPIDDEGQIAGSIIKYFDGSTELTELKQEVSEGASVTIDNTYTSAGYIMNSWNTAIDGSGTTYALGQSVTPSSDLILYAQKTINCDAVVTIGGTSTYYSTLAEAIAAIKAVDGEVTATIKLLRDVNISTRLDPRYGSTATVRNACVRNLTFDLDGHTINYTGTSNGWIIISNKTTLNVTGGGTINTGAKPFTGSAGTGSTGSTINLQDVTWITTGSSWQYGAQTYKVSGGSYSLDPTSYVVANYQATLNSNTGLYDVDEKHNFAVTIDGVTTYKNLFADAWAEATAATEATIKVLVDTSLTANMADIPGTCALTLDLNGKTISTTKRFVQTYGDLTITDTTADKAGAIIYNGSLTSSSYGIVQASYSSTKGTGTFTLEAGTIKAESSWPGPAVVTTSTSGSNIEINIKGGTIEAYTGQDAIAVRKGTCTIVDGKVVGALDNASGAGMFDITGGVFSVDPTAYLKTSLYEAVANTPSTGLYTVGLKSGLAIIAYVDGEGYCTVADAVAAVLAKADKTGTIVLTGETLDSPITISDAEADITIDLDGKTVKPAANSRFISVSSAASITVTNGTVLSNGVLSVAGLIYLKETVASLTGLTVNGDPTGGDTQTNTTKKNGTVYLMACDATFDNVTIKNCKAYDSAAMTGNSGAIHLVRNTSNNNKGTNLTMTNCIISNCASSVQGGAISVGSDCVLNLDSSNIIENCSSANGGAIFVDVADYDVDRKVFNDSAFGTANIASGVITNCAATGSISKAPIFSRGVVYIDEAVTTTGDVYQDISIGKLDGYSLTLSDSLSFTFTASKVACATADADKTVNVKLYTDDSATAELTDLTETGDFTIYGINLAQMGNVFKVQLCAGDTPISTPRDVSVQNYVEALIGSEDKPFAAKTVAANALAFGSEVQKYWTEGAGEAVTLSEAVLSYVTTALPSSSNSVKATTVHNTTSATTDKVKNATVNVADKVAIAFTAVVSEGGRLVIKKGNTVVATTNAKEGGGEIYLQADRISPTEYAETYTAEVQNAGGTVLHAVTYSVDSYTYAMQGDAHVGALAKALFNYSQAARAY